MLYKYKKAYSRLINKPITIDSLNDFTFKLRQKAAELYIHFNRLNFDYLLESLEDNSEGDNTILFDVISFCPSDYVLALYIEYDIKYNILIRHVSIES